MKIENKKKILVSAICMIVILFSFSIAKIPPSHADSGFDSSYDSGGSSSSSSSSHNSSSSSSNGSSSGTSASIGDFITFLGIIGAFLIPMVIYAKIDDKNHKKRVEIWNNVEKKLSYKELEKECKRKIEKIDQARIRNNLEPVQNILLPELYQKYQKELEKLSKSNNELLIGYHNGLDIKSLKVNKSAEDRNIEITVRIYKTECIAEKNTNKIIKGTTRLRKYQYQIIYKISSTGKEWFIGE